ncbi:hypothetical protein HDU96_000185 [Phlyctochytrium bullatum]|nr:hypothetical protein HDU96_000185 [Phlyctochytrium bullatum]
MAKLRKAPKMQITHMEDPSYQLHSVEIDAVDGPPLYVLGPQEELKEDNLQVILLSAKDSKLTDEHSEMLNTSWVELRGMDFAQKKIRLEEAKQRFARRRLSVLANVERVWRAQSVDDVLKKSFIKQIVGVACQLYGVDYKKEVQNQVAEEFKQRLLFAFTTCKLTGADKEPFALPCFGDKAGVIEKRIASLSNERTFLTLCDGTRVAVRYAKFQHPYISKTLKEFTWVQRLLHRSLKEEYGGNGIYHYQDWEPISLDRTEEKKKQRANELRAKREATRAQQKRPEGRFRVRGLPIARFFGSVAYNVDCMTLPHKDVGDEAAGWCFVVTFGDFDDGDLVFVEAAIQIKQRDFQVLGFKSSLLTHFNRTLPKM